MLIRRHPTMAFPQLPPKLVKLRISADTATSRAAMFTSYLSGVLSIDGVHSCQELAMFFSDHHVTPGGDDSGLPSALGFLLQAVSPHVEEVKRGSTFQVDVEVTEAHIADASVLIWQFRPETCTLVIQSMFNNRMILVLPQRALR